MLYYKGWKNRWAPRFFGRVTSGTAGSGIATSCAFMSGLPFLRLIEHAERAMRFTNFAKNYANLADARNWLTGSKALVFGHVAVGVG